MDRPAVYGPESAVYRDQPKSLTNLQWSSGEVPKGDEVTLSCSSSGVRDGAAVMFSIYPDGANPETDPPLMDIRGVNRGSSASVKWVARDIRKPESENPMKWFFTAWTLYCPKEQSGLIEVTRVLPEFSELKWELVSYDEDGVEESREEVTEIEHGLTATLSAAVENMEDGENVYVLVYEEGYTDPNAPLTRRLVEIKDGKVEDTWKVGVSRERLEELTENDELKFVFAVQTLDKVRSEDSGTVQAVFVYRHFVTEENEGDGTFSIVSTDDSGSAYNQELSPSSDGIAEENKIRLDFSGLKPGHDYALFYKSSGNDIKAVRRSTPFIQWVM